MFVIFKNSTSSKSKKRKSLVISNPIPCNTAFPADHVSIFSAGDNAKDVIQSSPSKQSQSISEETSRQEENSDSSKDVNSSDSDLSSSGTNTPKRESMCDNESIGRSSGSQVPEEEAETAADVEAELATNQSDDSGVGVTKIEAAAQEASGPSDPPVGDTPQSPEQELVTDPPPVEAKPKPPPVPAPRISFRSPEKPPLMTAAQQREEEAVTDDIADSGDGPSSQNPPGFLYKVQSATLSDEGEMKTSVSFSCQPLDPDITFRFPVLLKPDMT